MKERGHPLPVAVPGVHARGVYVIYDDGRPLVEAYNGPQIVGMDLRFDHGHPLTDVLYVGHPARPDLYTRPQSSTAACLSTSSRRR
jgi:hypothetical protein